MQKHVVRLFSAHQQTRFGATKKLKGGKMCLKKKVLIEAFLNAVAMVAMATVWFFSPSEASVLRQLEGETNRSAGDSAVARVVEFPLSAAVRFGGGLLYDDRAPGGVLGGAELALDIKPNRLPIVFSISAEYWKKSPWASRPCEIQDMTALNLFYTRTIFSRWRTDIYLGGGIGRLSVPSSEDTSATVSGTLFDLVGGVNVKLFWKLGSYGALKYIHAAKTVDDVKVIDFDDAGYLVGISVNFGW